MPRKKRQSKTRTNDDLRRLLTNPFTLFQYRNGQGEFCHPFDDPAFNKGAAYRLWREIREEVLAAWSKRRRGLPPGAELFDGTQKKERTVS